MNSKAIWLGAGIGSTAGTFVPYLWGDTSFLSLWALLFSTVGGLVGIWAVYKLYN